jgi:TetR/AcrR family transcriptional regulator
LWKNGNSAREGMAVATKVEKSEQQPARTDTRSELIAATSALMIERDSVDVSLSDIAGRACSNVALVKYYFGNKDGLLVALLERDVLGAIAALGRLMATDAPALLKMQHHISGLLRTYHRYPYLNRLVRSVIRDSSPERAKDLAQRLVGPICKSYEGLIDQGVREGTFRKVDPMLLYFSMVGACDQLFSGQGVLKALFDVPNIDDDLRRRFVDHTVALLTQGVIAPSSTPPATSLHYLLQ